MRIPKSAPTIALCLVTVIYVGCLAGLGVRGFWIIDNAVKFIQVRTLIDNDYRDLAIDLPGQDLDPSFHYNPMPLPFGFVRDGELYTIFPPFFAFLSSLPYRLMGFAGLYLLPLSGGLLALVAMRRIFALIRPESGAATLLVVLLGLATPLWFYSIVFWEHILAVALALWGLYYGLRLMDGGGRRELVAAAALLAGSVYFRDDYLLAAPAWLLVMAMSGERRDLRSLLMWCAVFVVTLVPLALFNQLLFGNPLGTHIADHLGTSGGLVQHLTDRPRVIYNLLLDSGGSLLPSLLFAGPLTVLLLVRPVLKEQRLAPTLLGLGLFAIAYNIFLVVDLAGSDGRLGWLRAATSLFPLAPVVVLGLVSAVRTGDEKSNASPTRRLAMFTAIYCVFYVLASPVLGSKGFDWANRHLLLVYPLLTLAAVTNLSALAGSHDRRRIWLRVVVVILCVSSLGWQMYAVSRLDLMKRFSRELEATLAAEQPTVVITDVFWMPQMAYAHIDKTPMFYVRQRDHFPPLVERLAAQGYRSALFVTQTAAGTGVLPDAVIAVDGLDYFRLKAYHVPLE